MRLPELLDSLRTLDEHSRLEAKAASQIGDSILTTVCAFANEPGAGGGTILLGIEQVDSEPVGTRYVVTGVPDPDKLQLDLVSQCRSVFNVPVSVSVTAERDEDRTVLIVDVPEAAPGMKPIYFARKPLPGSAFRRLGSADVKCTHDDVANLHQLRSAVSFDASTIEGASLTDADPDAIAVYRAIRTKGNPHAPELAYDDRDLLIALRCANSTASGVALTVAGLVLFGKSAALRRLFPLLRLDYMRVAGPDWVPKTGERFETTLDMRGPLLTLLERTQAAIADDLPRDFRLPEGALRREEVPSLPLRVIREAVVNAAMHRSYRAPQPTQIIRYTNKLEILNPGYSLKAPDRLGEPGSEPRNPTIAAVLHELGFAETKGTGIRAMQLGMREARLSPPRFESDRTADQFKAVFYTHHFLGVANTAWLGHFKDLNLTDGMREALVFVREQRYINNAVYRDLAQVHPTDATRDLRYLCDLGLLLPEGNRINRIYRPGPVVIGAIPPSEGPDPTTAEVPSMLVKPSAIQDSGIAILDRASAIPDNESPMVDNVTDHRPIRDLEIVTAFKKLGGRANPEQLRHAIWQLCEVRAHSATALAKLLNRTDNHIREAIRAMVADRQLEYAVKDARRHPEQAYLALPREKSP